VTNLLDPQLAPALELAALYHERWEIEGVFAEFKTHLRANSTVLRSKTPELVEQELWGLLLAHFAVRQLMAQAAWPRGLDPDRLSFTVSVWRWHLENGDASADDGVHERTRWTPWKTGVGARGAFTRRS
jgi:IS4 transposase